MRSILDLAERDPPDFEVGRSTVDVVCAGDNIGFGQVRGHLGLFLNARYLVATSTKHRELTR